MHLVPNQLRAYYKAYKLKRKIRDEEAWLQWGSYGISAFIVAIDRCLNGKKSKAEYIEKPITQSINENKDGLSEEKLQRQRELFVAKLQAMQMNFELNKKSQ